MLVVIPVQTGSLSIKLGQVFVVVFVVVVDRSRECLVWGFMVVVGALTTMVFCSVINNRLFLVLGRKVSFVP